MTIHQDEHGNVVATGNAVYLVHYLAVRSALMLEIRTGMKFSNRGSILTTLQRQGITTKRTKAGALKDLETFMQNELGWSPAK